MTVAFYTLGCKLNQSETEAVAEQFRHQGYLLVPASEAADLYVVNTCTVTSKSEQKARRMLRLFLRRNPRAVVIATGCYAQVSSRELSDLSERIVVLPLSMKDRLLDLPFYLSGRTEEDRLRQIRHWQEEAFSVRESSSSIPGQFRFQAEDQIFHTRSFVKIQDGCDNHCAYCRVCIARGASVSLSAPEVIKRIKRLAEKGSREVVLTGVNLSDWKEGPLKLADLLEELLRETPPSLRFRLSSLEPDRIDEALLEVMKSPRICPHFHLPLQAGSNAVLHRMGRNYTVQLFRQVVQRLRQIREDPFIAVDIIVGFPGESEEDFMAARDLLQELDLAAAHVFPFSPRPDTPACTMTPRVPERIIKERASSLRALLAGQKEQYRNRQKGKWLSLVLEEQLPDGRWKGITENYLSLTFDSLEDLEKKEGLLFCEF